MIPARATAFWIAMLLVALLPSAGPANAQSAPAVSPQASATFSDIAGCLAGSDGLSVLLVIDESRSLLQEDPEVLRKDGLLAALNSLELLQQAYPDKTINVAASTFARVYTPRVGWGEADGGHLARLRSFVTDDVPRLTNGDATDYRVALNGGLRDFQDQGPCRMMLWFTDGGLDVDGGEAAALQEICTPNGIADSLRRNGVHMVAAALFRPGSNLVTDADRTTLAQVVEGQSGGGTCGAVPLPERFAGGAYVPANDPGQLSLLFSLLLARASGFTPIDSADCPDPGVCVDGEFRFTVDPGLTGMRLILLAVDGEPSYTLRSPAGDGTDLGAGSSSLGSLAVETNSSGGTTLVDVSLGEGGQGDWVLTVADGVAHVELLMLADLTVALDPADQVLQGDAATDVRLRLAYPDGSVVDPQTYQAFEVRGGVSDAGAATAQRDGDSWVLAVPAPAPGSLPPNRRLTVTVDIVTQPSGRTLEPVTRTFDMPVSVSAAYPQILTEPLVLSRVEGQGIATGVLEVAGSSLPGTSTVCLDAVSLTGPDTQASVVATAESPCLELGQNQTGQIEVQTEAIQVLADGTMFGEAQATLTGVRAEDPAVVFGVPTQLDIARPVAEAVRWFVVLLLVLLSLLLPLALVYLVGRRLARFDTGRAKLAGVLSAPVSVSHSGTTAELRRDGGPFTLRADDVQRWSPTPHGATEFSGAGMTTRTVFGGGRHWWRSPSAALRPRAIASVSEPGAVLVSSRYPHTVDSVPGLPRAAGAESDLVIDRHWFLKFRASDLLRATGPDGLSPSGTVPAQFLAVRLDTDSETHAEFAQRLRHEGELIRRMLEAAVAGARRAATSPAEVVLGAGAAAAAPVDDNPFQYQAGPGSSDPGYHLNPPTWPEADADPYQPPSPGGGAYDPFKEPDWFGPDQANDPDR